MPWLPCMWAKALACLLALQREGDKPHSEHVLQGCLVDRLLVMRTGLTLLAVQAQMETDQRSGMSDGQCPA